MKYDFVIVCPQRSGSCLLVTALNSHPDISCEVNVVRNTLGVDIHDIDSNKKIKGKVVRYNVLSEIRQANPDKVIHLKRDLTDAARSLIIHKWNVRSSGVSLHRFRDQSLTIDIRPLGTPHFEFFTSVVKNTFEELQREALKAIGSLPRLTIDYEKITDGCSDIEEIPFVYSERILKFLGASVIPLKTSLGRTGPYK